MDELVSRQAVEDWLQRWEGYLDQDMIERMQYRVIDIPTAEPKRGRWEMKPDPYEFFDEIPVCSECGCTTKWREKYPYCPNCGAQMEEGNEHTD